MYSDIRLRKAGINLRGRPSPDNLVQAPARPRAIFPPAYAPASFEPRNAGIKSPFLYAGVVPALHFQRSRILQCKLQNRGARGPRSALQSSQNAIRVRRSSSVVRACPLFFSPDRTGKHRRVARFRDGLPGRAGTPFQITAPRSDHGTSSRMRQNSPSLHVDAGRANAFTDRDHLINELEELRDLHGLSIRSKNHVLIMHLHFVARKYPPGSLKLML